MDERTKWPETVPVLGAEDMCIGPYRAGDCGCLQFHTNQAITKQSDGPGDVVGAVYLALNRAHEDLKTAIWRQERRRDLRFRDPATYREHEGLISRRMVARVWNRGMAILGYVVGNPECTRSGKLKPVK